MELSEVEQVEYDALHKELVAQGGPTKGHLKEAGRRAPEKVKRLMSLGWVSPEGPKDIPGELNEKAEQIAESLPTTITPDDIAGAVIPALGEVPTDGPAVDLLDKCGDCQKLETECDNRTAIDDVCAAFSPKPVDPTGGGVNESSDTPLLDACMAAVGEASGCWENLEGAGVFEAARAEKVAIALVDKINEIISAANIELTLGAPRGVSITVGETTHGICIVNTIPKRNIFLADAVRMERDLAFLNAEIGQRKYKGKIKSITTIKHCEVIDGNWVTEFDIELKEPV